MYLKSTFFNFKNEFYDIVKGVATGSPLSPIVTNLYMQEIEKQAIHSFPLNPKRWKCFVDETDVVWQHGEENLNKFFSHLNNLRSTIKFTMEIEKDMSLPFLDVLVSRKK